MRSGTSYFNGALSRSLLRRFWPLIAAYALTWGLVGPLPLYSQYVRARALNAWAVWRDALSAASNTGVLMGLMFGICFAMAMFSHLASPRATNGLHALPARRETLFCTAYLTGLAAQAAVLAVNAALMGLVLSALGVFRAAVFAQLFAPLLPMVYAYSFGALCMVFTGQILAAPVFYGILNFLAVGLDALLSRFAGTFLYGWAGGPSGAVSVLLSPAYAMFVRVEVRTRYVGEDYWSYAYRYDPALEVADIRIQGLGLLAAYAAAGLLLAVLAMLVYRARHSEDTGSVVAIRWARPVFQYGVSFCAALALGQMLYSLIFGQHFSNGAFSLPGMLGCMAAAGLIGFFTAEMLLRKTVRVWKTGWKGALIVAAALTALGLTLSLDLTGYEGRVPAEADVEYAEVGLSAYGRFYTSANFYDEASLRLLTDAHRAVIADKARQQRGDDADDGELHRGYLYAAYHLKNGGMIERRYELIFDRAERNDPASLTGRIEALAGAQPLLRDKAFGGAFSNDLTQRERELTFTGGLLSTARKPIPRDPLSSVYLPQTYDEEVVERELSAAEARAVYEAIERDLAAGRVKNPIFEESEYWDCTVELYYSYAGRDSQYDSSMTRTSITREMTDTIAVLTQLVASLGVTFEYYVP